MTIINTNNITSQITYNRLKSAAKRRDINVDDELRALLHKELLSSLKEMIRSGAFSQSGQAPVFTTVPKGANPYQGQDLLNGGNYGNFSIDQMVASALMSGSQTAGILRKIFGVMPSLIGR